MQEMILIVERDGAVLKIKDSEYQPQIGDEIHGVDNWDYDISDENGLVF